MCLPSQLSHKQGSSMHRFWSNWHGGCWNCCPMRACVYARVFPIHSWHTDLLSVAYVAHQALCHAMNSDCHFKYELFCREGATLSGRQCAYKVLDVAPALVSSASWVRRECVCVAGFPALALHCLMWQRVLRKELCKGCGTEWILWSCICDCSFCLCPDFSVSDIPCHCSRACYV